MNTLQTRLYLMLSGIFFGFLLFNVFDVTILPIREIAFTTMEWMKYGALLYIGYILYEMRKARRPISDNGLTPFYSSLGLFIVISILLHVINGNFDDNLALIDMLLTFAFIAATAHIRWEASAIILFAQMSLFIVVLIFFHWMLSGMPMSDFQSVIRNPNILGVFLSCLLFFQLVAFGDANKWKKALYSIGILLALFMIYTSSARAVLLLLLTVIAAQIVLFFSKRVFYYLFYAVLAFNLLFLVLYSTLAKSSMFTRLNQWSVENFGKNLFSGRQDIWETAFYYGLERPLTGHKVGITPDEYIKGAHFVHVHNQYLQIFLESGFIGLACFILFLFGIWKVLQKNLDVKIVRWSACFFLGILIYQNLEISLFFNIQPIGLFHWLIVSLGISGVLFSASERKRHSSKNF
ncbi:hypothetical protein DCC39_17860 [Pueribacillus theae]|uniref:O-antigen ligase-related domain-containing protein n=1 Tax=Pueribacillus theae TaxID=2171751 RepID=A0A2U1JKR2_9BACI|nr:O-antigen ligase family protein [Pueribacillus theae]PWA05761.1 hypothetical protein DCC39_17860 [Pueribacillus theae]